MKTIGSVTSLVSGLALVFALALASPGIHAGDDATKSPEAGAWKGKTRAEILEIFGKPLKKKRSRKGSVLTYDGPVRWLVDPQWSGTGPKGYEATGGKGKVKVRTYTNNSPSGNANDPSEVLTDSEGRAIGSYSGSMPIEDGGGAVTELLRFFFDRDGRVTKVKLGKKRIE